MKYFKLAMSLPIFYYYLITNNFKKYDMAVSPKELTVILCTPVAFFLAHMIFLISMISVLNPSAVLTLFLFIPFFFINLAITLTTQSKGHSLRFEEEQRRRKERRMQREREEEEARKRRQEKWKREWEENRKEQEQQRQRRQKEYEEWRKNFKREHDNFWRMREEGYYFENFHNRVDQNRKNAMHLLDLKEPFTKQDVKSAYRKLVKVHHPDAGGLQANFVKLNKAYNYLMERM